jgi:circadian clock protein KaiB
VCGGAGCGKTLLGVEFLVRGATEFDAHYLLRLLVTGSTPRSDRAVIDINQHPEPEQIVVTPTLGKKLPLPFRKIIGDLSDKERVLVGLDIVPCGLPGKPPEACDGV